MLHTTDTSGGPYCYRHVFFFCANWDGLGAKKHKQLICANKQKWYFYLGNHAMYARSGAMEVEDDQEELLDVVTVQVLCPILLQHHTTYHLIL